MAFHSLESLDITFHNRSLGGHALWARRKCHNTSVANIYTIAVRTSESEDYTQYKFMLYAVCNIKTMHKVQFAICHVFTPLSLLPIWVERYALSLKLIPVFAKLKPA
eukprot:2581233-Amphidinium_carterae.1